MLSRRFAFALLIVAVLAALPQCSSAGMVTYEAYLDGPSEFPPNASPGTGYALVTIDDVVHSMRVQIEFSGLIGTTTVAHIHSATTDPFAGLAIVATTTPTFPGFPVGVTNGMYDMTFDLTMAGSYNPAFVTANGGMAAGAEAALIAGLDEGKAYLNIHTTTFPGGEIRGFFRPVPEPASLALFGIGAACVGIARLRRKSQTVPLN